MNCIEVKKWTEGYLEGEMDVDGRLQLEQHLKHCSRCRSEVHAYRQTWRMLGDLTEIEPAPDYLERFRQRAAIGPPWHRVLAEGLRNAFARRWALPAFSAAMAGLLVLAIVGPSDRYQPRTDAIFSKQNDVELELLAHMEMVEDLDIINELDLLSDIEIIENLNGRNAS